MKIVLKFGGTSVGNGKKIDNVCNIIQIVKKDYQVIVGSSALQSTTDELLELSEDAKKGKIYEKIINDRMKVWRDKIVKIKKNKQTES